MFVNNKNKLNCPPQVPYFRAGSWPLKDKVHGVPKGVKEMACMTCLWEVVCCQIIYVYLKKKKKENKFYCAHCLLANPPDICPAGMGIWVRLSRFVFGVVALR